MRKLFLLALALLAMAAQAQTIDLAGEWLFATGDTPEYTDRVTLPGSMLTNGKGDDVTVNTRWVGSLYDSSFYFNPYMEKYRVAGRMKFPFFLTPKKHYVGTAWYKRSVDIPREWRKQSVILHLERPHIETTVFVNGQEAGRDSSLSVPHEFDITPYIIYGKANEIAIRVYNGIENVCVGQDSHSVTDQTQGCWNGIAGRMTLEARPLSHITDVQVFPNVGDKNIRVTVRLKDNGKRHKLSLQHRLVWDGTKENPEEGHDVDGTCSDATVATVEFRGDSLSAVFPMGDDVRLWDEFSPSLYRLDVCLDGHDTRSVTFGMREISIRGRQFYVNEKPVWMRGTVENCCFPLTGYPPTDEESWLRIFRKCREYGLNMMRFHSYCPPEAAFAAADKTGFYLQPEGPSWPNHGVKLGNRMSIDRYLMEETQRMARAYGNHPSFCMLAAGNEPAGGWVRWAGNFVDRWKQSGDRRRVYCGASVGGGWAWDPKSEYHVKGGARGLEWDNSAPQAADDYHKDIVSFTQKGRKEVTFDINEPYLSHEQGQWCAFPDLKEVAQYTGAYRAGNFEIFADLLRDNGMASRAEKFLMASGRLQTLAYKYETERNLRTPDYAGFQLLSLNDYSGQGTALVGVLNVFWREKGYCTADEWRRFCAPVVPLARFPKFVFTNDETAEVPVELYNAYKEALVNARVEARVSGGEGDIAVERNAPDDTTTAIPQGKNNDLGVLRIALAGITKPSKLTLTISVTSDNAPKAENTWDFWVYPRTVEMPQENGIYITDTLDAKALDVLSRGGRVLIEAAGRVRMGSDIKQTYLPVFWNTSWFKMRPPHTTGAVIDTSHPLFRDFPTDDWSNLNWWELLNRAQVMNLGEFPADYQPPVQPIDTWHISRKIGMIVEANVLKGRLLMTTMDIANDLDSRVVARQMRKAIIGYMQGEDFRPSLTLDPQTITNLFEKDAPAVRMFTNDSPDELKPKLK